jgi:hypothetical protein
VIERLLASRDFVVASINVDHVEPIYVEEHRVPALSTRDAWRPIPTATCQHLLRQAAAVDAWPDVASTLSPPPSQLLPEDKNLDGIQLKAFA